MESVLFGLTSNYGWPDHCLHNCWNAWETRGKGLILFILSELRRLGGILVFKNKMEYLIVVCMHVKFEYLVRKFGQIFTDLYVLGTRKWSENELGYLNMVCMHVKFEYLMQKFGQIFTDLDVLDTRKWSENEMEYLIMICMHVKFEYLVRKFGQIFTDLGVLDKWCVSWNLRMYTQVRQCV